MEEKFEGINEYDDKNKLLNFDINDIIDSIDSLNKKELEFLNHITKTAQSKVSRTEENDKMIYHIIKFQVESDAYEKYSSHSSNRVDDNFTDEELEAYLKKYSIIDLEQFRRLLELSCFEYNVTRLYK